MKLFKVVLLLLLILVLSLIVLYLFKNKIIIDKFENNKNIKIVLVHATWCGHCKKYRQTKIFDEKLPNKLKNNDKYANVIIQELDYDEHKDFAEKYNINSFPTILIIKDDKDYKFKGNRDNIDELILFIDGML